MILHNIAPEVEKRWIWLHAQSGSGRSLGRHAWEIEVGRPPPLSRPNRAGRTPARYTWGPFNNLGLLFQNGWIRPLCGRTTTATHCYIQVAYQYDSVCANCVAQANEQNIVVDYHARIVENLQIALDLRDEYTEWDMNGRHYNDGQDNAPEVMEVYDRRITLLPGWRGTIIAMVRTQIRWVNGRPNVDLWTGDRLLVTETTTERRPAGEEGTVTLGQPNWQTIFDNPPQPVTPQWTVVPEATFTPAPLPTGWFTAPDTLHNGEAVTIEGTIDIT